MHARTYKQLLFTGTLIRTKQVIIDNISNNLTVEVLYVLCFYNTVYNTGSMCFGTLFRCYPFVVKCHTAFEMTSP